jgi:hypothetical protein
MPSHKLVGAALVAALGLSLFSVGCGDDGVGTDENDLTNAEKNGSRSQKWVYWGKLPKLDGPSMFVSLKAHTARVTGLLPTSFTGELPFYAVPKALSDGRTQVTLVYPVATGKIDPSTGLAPAGPGTYTRLYAVPYTPTNSKATWGGFPFMAYNSGRGLAFHGPITSVYDAEMGDYQWRLTRGPVSHGCQRMQGEHVVELAHLLGIDMSKPHSSGESYRIDMKVVISKDFDQVDGQYVDVDYPALASVERPKTNVAMFPTWDSNDFPRWVCAYDKTRALDAHHCDAVGEERRDWATGELFEQPPEEPFVGTACTSTEDCPFQVNGVSGACLTSGGDGYCTLKCEGYCPDKEGASRTFCADLGIGNGQCVAKAGVENRDCADIPGTHIAVKKRFVGKSGAKSAEASVCTF